MIRRKSAGILSPTENRYFHFKFNTKLTRNLNKISGNELTGADHLNSVGAGTDDLGHLGLVLFQGFDSRLGISFLPDSDGGIGDQNKEDNKGLNKGGDGFRLTLVLLKKGKNLNFSINSNNKETLQKK